jgi:hypothetical protein
MSGPIIRSGPSPQFTKNWDSVFGKAGKKSAAPPEKGAQKAAKGAPAAPKAAKKKAAKTAAAKKGAKKGKK